MSALGFSSQVEVTAQVKIIATKTQKPLTKCENHSFLAILKTGANQTEQDEHMRSLAKARYKQDFLNRIKDDVATKRLVGQTEWHVEVLNVDYN